MCGEILLWFQKCDKNCYFSRTRCWLIFLLRTGRHRAEWSTLDYRWGSIQGWRWGEGDGPGSWGMTAVAFSLPIMGGLYSPAASWSLVHSFMLCVCFFHSVFTEYLLCAKYYDRGWAMNGELMDRISPVYTQTVDSACALQDLDN